MWAVAGVVLAVAIAALIWYWIYFITEGAYLGSRAVVYFYDRDAAEYDDIKDVDPDFDQSRVVEPLLKALDAAFDVPAEALRVLDVATGTGRVPAALLAEPAYQGAVVGLDLSRGMLAEAWRKVGGWAPRVHMVRAPATPLPFESDCFHAVVSLEALEFLPDADLALREMIRVLVPGGILVTTNRVGLEARLMPGRAFRRADFEGRLAAHGLTGVRTERWQTLYDLIWALKPRSGADEISPAAFPQGLVCPVCAGALEAAAATLRCAQCPRHYGWRSGAWDLTDR